MSNEDFFSHLKPKPEPEEELIRPAVNPVQEPIRDPDIDLISLERFSYIRGALEEIRGKEVDLEPILESIDTLTELVETLSERVGNIEDTLKEIVDEALKRAKTQEAEWAKRKSIITPEAEWDELDDFILEETPSTAPKRRRRIEYDSPPPPRKEIQLIRKEPESSEDREKTVREAVERVLERSRAPRRNSTPSHKPKNLRRL